MAAPKKDLTAQDRLGQMAATLEASLGVIAGLRARTRNLLGGDLQPDDLELVMALSAELHTATFDLQEEMRRPPPPPPPPPPSEIAQPPEARAAGADALGEQAGDGGQVVDPPAAKPTASADAELRTQIADLRTALNGVVDEQEKTALALADLVKGRQDAQEQAAQAEARAAAAEQEADVLREQNTTQAQNLEHLQEELTAARSRLERTAARDRLEVDVGQLAELDGERSLRRCGLFLAEPAEPAEPAQPPRPRRPSAPPRARVPEVPDVR